VFGMGRGKVVENNFPPLILLIGGEGGEI